MKVQRWKKINKRHRATYENLTAILGLEGEPWTSHVETYDVFHVSLHREGTSWGLMISLMAFAGVESRNPRANARSGRLGRNSCGCNTAYLRGLDTRPRRIREHASNPTKRAR